MSDTQRDWTQEELRAHLIAEGWSDAVIGTDPIPQLARLGPAKITVTDLEWATRVMSRLAAERSSLPGVMGEEER